jgi:hypothetical protein
MRNVSCRLFVFEYLVPIWWWCFGGGGGGRVACIMEPLERQSLAGEGTSLGAGSGHL